MKTGETVDPRETVYLGETEYPGETGAPGEMLTPGDTVWTGETLDPVDGGTVPNPVVFPYTGNAMLLGQLGT